MVDSKIIEKTVYDLCVQANTILPESIHNKILQAYKKELNLDAKQALGLILINAQMAYERKMPLCQDTGQVLVFVQGKNIPHNIDIMINNAVSKSYEENFFRKSIVKNALFERVNTKTNTPCIIYKELTNNENLEIDVLIKGAGCENVSVTEMLSPTASEDEIIEFIVSSIKKAGSKGCPPYFLGIGIGGTMEYAGLLSKKALILEENIDEKHENFANKIKDAVNKLEIGPAGFGGAATALDIKILTDFTHIACMPVAITVNCHSSRHAKSIIDKNGQVEKVNLNENELLNRQKINLDLEYEKIHTSEISKLKELKKGQKILLSGELYIARDMAHKRLVEMIEKGEKLPFDLKDKIIFYAGPCPGGRCNPTVSNQTHEPGCSIGSIGPTTAYRMDKYATILHKNGVLATIGKGERSKEVQKAIKDLGGIYFTAIGGIACYLSDKIQSSTLVAFGEYGTEALYRIEVESFPVTVNIC